MNKAPTIKILLTALIVAGVILAGQAQAHFQMIIPSDDMVKQRESRKITIDVLFWHPFEGIGMNMVKPVQFGVVNSGKKTDLLAKLKAVKKKDRAGDVMLAYSMVFAIRRPGDHVFFIEPQPYWEAAEEVFIIHYTKVIVNAFGLEEGWDQDVGLKTEITPLTRPYGLYTGNVFQGIVKVKGKPVPFAEVEVEYYDEQGQLSASADPLITQVVKADKNGVFTYAMPRAGWWGFAALNEDEETMLHDGKAYPVEIGAVLWVKTHDMQ